MDILTWRPLSVLAAATFRSCCSGGKFCNREIPEVLQLDPDTGRPSSGAPPLGTYDSYDSQVRRSCRCIVISQKNREASSVACNGCLLSSLAQMLKMPMSSAAQYTSDLSSLQVSCKTTVPWTAPSKTEWVIACVTRTKSRDLWNADILVSSPGRQPLLQAARTAREHDTRSGPETHATRSLSLKATAPRS